MPTIQHDGFSRQRAQIEKAFDVQGPLLLLPGGEGRTFKAGSAVFRRESDPEEAEFIANVVGSLRTQGFRVAVPLTTQAGGWISAEGWSAWEYMDGEPMRPGDVPEVIEAVESFHRSLALVSKPPYLDRRDSPYVRADRRAWDEAAVEASSELRPFVEKLQAYAGPARTGPAQLIHGDLNPENVLIAPGAPPGIIDLTPYLRPPEYGLAILAYWMGPDRGELEILKKFTSIPNFDWMLVRAGLRELFISDEFLKLGRPIKGGPGKVERPAGIILEWINSQAPGRIADRSPRRQAAS